MFQNDVSVVLLRSKSVEESESTCAVYNVTVVQIGVHVQMMSNWRQQTGEKHINMLSLEEKQTKQIGVKYKN